MAGVKGKSGGTRSGAGRKKKPAPKVAVNAITAEALKHTDPKDFLLAVMNAEEGDARLRIDAAKALMPFMHQKIGEGGKKEGRQEAAAKVGKGKFAPGFAPKLVVNHR